MREIWSETLCSARDSLWKRGFGCLFSEHGYARVHSNAKKTHAKTKHVPCLKQGNDQAITTQIILQLVMHTFFELTGLVFELTGVGFVTAHRRGFRTPVLCVRGHGAVFDEIPECVFLSLCFVSRTWCTPNNMFQLVLFSQKLASFMNL